MPAAAVATVHPLAVVQLRRALEHLGLAADAVLRRAGLSERHLRGEIRAPRRALLAAKALAARTARDPCLGFRLGRLTRLENFGVWGAAVQHAASLRDALQVSIKHLAVWEQETAIDITPSDPGRLRIAYRSMTSTSSLANAIDGQQTVVFMLQAARALLGREARICAGFACDRPRHAGCQPPEDVECRYREHIWYVEVPDAIAPARAGRRGDHPALGAALERVLADEAARVERPRDLRTHVRAVLREHLAAGWGLADVASALGLSPRVLQQRLLAAGTRFSDQQAAVRVEVARALLAQADRPVKDVARAVGFADVAPFSRFLRRRTGRPPSAYRRSASTTAASARIARQGTPRRPPE